MLHCMYMFQYNFKLTYLILSNKIMADWYKISINCTQILQFSLTSYHIMWYFRMIFAVRLTMKNLLSDKLWNFWRFIIQLAAWKHGVMWQLAKSSSHAFITSRAVLIIRRYYALLSSSRRLVYWTKCIDCLKIQNLNLLKVYRTCKGYY